ncbi:Uncharacterised protein [Mycobacteroides abscessus subsp. abscessus]|nr:Uncharacterised protein [Mycobacteroides abscessus subsp. abscessus]
MSVPARVESLPRRLYPVTWCPRLRSSAAMREPTIPVAPNIAIFMGHVPSSICVDAPRYPMVTWYLKVTNGAFGECSCPRGVATAAAVSGHLVSAAA